MSTTRNTALDPLRGDRLRALLGTALRGPRLLVLRRATAVALVLLAGALALRPAGATESPHTRVVVAARDLAPGTTLGPADLAIRLVPAELRPAGALTSIDAGTGRILAGAARSGEPITDVRLVGPANTALTAGSPAAEAVPVRLADPGIADLLRPGTRVDVVTLDPDRQNDPVLADDATVVTVRDTDHSAGQHGRLVVIALPRTLATQVAAASLHQPVTVTLR